MIPAEGKQSVALVTGGSSGIGWAIACELAKRNYSLLLVSIQQELLKERKKDIEQRFGVRCLVMYSDLSVPGAAWDIFNFCKENDLMVEVLVNCAGFMLFSEFADADVNKVNAMINLHMASPAMLCRLFGQDMKQRKMGYILNVSSISAVMPYPGISLYGPTKSFLRAFSRALHTEMKEHGVHVTCLLPGAVATPLHDPEKVNLALAQKLHVMHRADYVASRAVRSLFKNRAECVPGFANKMVMIVLPMIPPFVIELINRHSDYLKKN